MDRCLNLLCLRHYTILDRSKKKLTQIPKDISRYEKTLTELNLQHNRITHLDKLIFRCKKLERLYLNDNTICEIPDDIGELIQLQDLHLNRNEIEEISDRIGNCQKLIYLDISSNNLQRLTDGITMLRNLQVLIMNEISISGIPSTISSLCNLRVLEARDNLIKTIPESISFLSKLNRMDLGCNEISTLPETIGQLQSLTELWLDTNILSQLPTEIGDLRNLEILELSNNPIHHLPESICNLENLTDLTLTSIPLIELPENIGYLKQLKILKVDFNQLKYLPDSICDITELFELYISGNYLTSLPTNFGNLKNLRTIHADYNHLKVLPDSICDCSELTIFSLRDNSLETLPEEMGSLSKLAVLDVSGNRLKFLPYSMHKMKKIKAMWLSKSQQKSIYPLQVDEITPYGKVLTNFMLPQITSKDDSHSVGSSNNSFGSLHKEDSKVNEQETTQANSHIILEDQQPHITVTYDDASRSSASAKNESHNKDVSENKNNKVTSDHNSERGDIFDTQVRELISTESQIVDFETEVVQLSCEKSGIGIEINLPETSKPFFSLHESNLVITGITAGSEAEKSTHLRVGDRILAINLIPMEMVTPSEATSLLNIHKDSLELLVRHDPPGCKFKKVTFKREHINEKLGLNVKNGHAGSPKGFNKNPSLIEIKEIEPFSLAGNNSVIKAGMAIVEVNGKCMINVNEDQFNLAIASAGEEINMVLYDKEAV